MCGSRGDIHANAESVDCVACFANGYAQENIFFFVQVAQLLWRLSGTPTGLPNKRIQTLQPEHLAFEDHAEVAGDGMGNLL